VHSKGLLFGVYTARCAQTCARRPASLNHEELDAHTFAIEWDADYLKEDSCRGCSGQDPMRLYEIMSAALNKTGKPVLFDMCWGSTENMTQRVVTGNSWRIGPDDGNWPNIVRNIDIDAGLSQYAGPGHWNNPCLLISAGQGSGHGVQRMVTERQTQSQFSAYAILAAPMIVSGSLLEISPHDLATYSNREVIAVSQDPLGKQGVRVDGGELHSHALFAEAQTPPIVRFDAIVTRSQAECDVGSLAQQWLPSTMEPNVTLTIRQNSSGLCLGLKWGNAVPMPSCGVPVTVVPCETPGARWRRLLQPTRENDPNPEHGSGTFALISELNRQPLDLYGGGDPGRRNIDMQTCTSPAFKSNNVWKFVANQHLISAQTGGCVTSGNVTVSGPRPPSGSPTNVWARQMLGGKVAMFFFNVGANTVDITCNAACLRRALGQQQQPSHLSSSFSSHAPARRYIVRDLIAHTDLPPLLVVGPKATYTAKAVSGSGGSATILLTPDKD
jgi:hypothetical protein